MGRTQWPAQVVLVALAAAVLVVGGCSGEPEQTTTAVSSPAAAPPMHATAGTADSPHMRDRVHDVAESDAPSVRMQVSPDPVGGWNVHLAVERFTFVPEGVNGQARPGEGHAHLNLDGMRVARVYGLWYHLRADDVGPGEHTLTVQLVGHDHAAWAVDGVPVSASAQITGTVPAAGGAAHDGTALAARADVIVTVVIDKGTIAPPPGRVEVAVGQTVHISVGSDRADTVHVRGYGLQAPVDPGIPATLTFVAGHAGLFDVEAHVQDVLLTQLLVR